MNKAVMYLRLSREDGDVKESNSIGSQRQIIREFAKVNDIELIREYVDDGFSGSNFNRPSFKKMIEDMGDRAFDTIIVKDLSRFGRDYIESGKYLQKIFPEKKIRFISVNDNYDSEKADVSDTHLILPIRNFINDSYCRDISMKVKSSKDMKRKKGAYISSFAPFGYKKDSKNKYRLVIDDKVAHIVKRIFEMKIEGYSSKKIADILNSLGMVTPAKYKEEVYGSCNGFISINAKWQAKMINRIIANRVYMGVLEQGKTTKLNYKSSRVVDVNREDWIVKEDAHEKIVSKSIFLLANKMLLRDVRNIGKPHLLSGMVFCHDCNSSMTLRRIKSKTKTNIQYSCSNYVKNNACSKHKISEEKILRAVVYVINNYCKRYNELVERLKVIDIRDFRLEVDTSRLKEEKKKYEHLRQSLYIDLEEELINAEEFETYRKSYLSKIREIEHQIERKNELYKSIKEKIENKDFSIKDTDIREDSLDRFTLVSFVDKILVKENEEIEVVLNNYEDINALEKVVSNLEDRDVEKNNTTREDNMLRDSILKNNIPNVLSFRKELHKTINETLSLGGAING